MFNQVYGGTAYEYGRCVRQTYDNGYLLVGSTSSAGNGLTDGYVVKTDSLGIAQWTKYFGGNNVDWLYSVKELRDSGFVMCGYSNSYGNGGYDGWLIRTDKNGDTLWTKTIGTDDWDFLYSVDTLPNNNGFVLCGGTYGAGTNDEAGYIVRTDMNGNVIWTKAYGGLMQDELNAITYNSNNTISCVGTVRSLGDSLGDIWVLNCTTFGDTLWSHREGLPGRADAGYGIVDFRVQYAMFICGTIEFSPGNNDAYINEILYTGAEAGWEYNFGSPAYDDFRGMAVMPDFDYAAIGTSFGLGAGYGDFYMFRAFANCYTTFGTLQEDVGYCISSTRDNGSIACGYTLGYNSILPNAFLVKISSACQSTNVVGIQQHQAISYPAAARVYPNPLTSQGTVMLSSHEGFDKSALQVSIYDLAGRYLGNYQDDALVQVSDHTATVVIHRRDLPAGSYVFRVSDETRVLATGKLLIAD